MRRLFRRCRALVHVAGSEHLGLPTLGRHDADLDVTSSSSGPPRAWRTATLLVSVVVVIAVVFGRGWVPCEAFATQPACYLAIGPGPIVDALAVVDVEDPVSEQADGALLLTTIVVTNGLTVSDWWSAIVSPTVETARRDTLFPAGQEPEEVRRRNAVAMANSQLEATIAALDFLGYELAPEGARIAVVLDDVVTDQLQVDDVVTAVGGTPVTTSGELAEVVGSQQPGSAVTLTVERDGQPRRIDVVVGVSPATGLGRIGVLAITEVALPVTVTIDAGSVGGPSAGMMFALAIIDRLTEASLPAGRVIAGTGTVSRDGTIGAVGGIRQKLPAASASETPAEVFLVPRANVADARRATVAAEVLVVPVDRLEDAVAALTLIAAGGQPDDAFVVSPP